MLILALGFLQLDSGRCFANHDMLLIFTSQQFINLRRPQKYIISGSSIKAKSNKCSRQVLSIKYTCSLVSN